jgi:hypothetical protein
MYQVSAICRPAGQKQNITSRGKAGGCQQNNAQKQGSSWLYSTHFEGLCWEEACVLFSILQKQVRILLTKKLAFKNVVT